MHAQSQQCPALCAGQLPRCEYFTVRGLQCSCVQPQLLCKSGCSMASIALNCVQATSAMCTWMLGSQQCSELCAGHLQRCRTAGHQIDHEAFLAPHDGRHNHQSAGVPLKAVQRRLVYLQSMQLLVLRTGAASACTYQAAGSSAHIAPGLQAQSAAHRICPDVADGCTFPRPAAAPHCQETARCQALHRAVQCAALCPQTACHWQAIQSCVMLFVVVCSRTPGCGREGRDMASRAAAFTAAVNVPGTGGG